MLGSSSLSRQLRGLKRNFQAHEDGTITRYSLVYNSEDVKKISVDAAHKNSRSAISDLERSDEDFEIFQGDLFSEESKYVSRVNLTQEDNSVLDSNIRRFLFHVSPYLRMTSAHMAIEWLIFKFEINIHNTEMFFFTFLPYYHTRIFRRAMMLIPESNSDFNGIVRIAHDRLVTFDDLLQVCRSCPLIVFMYFDFMNFGDDYTSFKNFSSIFSFFTLFILNFLSLHDSKLDDNINRINPFILKGINSSNKFYAWSCFTIFTKISHMVILCSGVVEKYLTNIVKSSHFNNDNFDGILILIQLLFLIDRQDMNEVPGFFLIEFFSKHKIDFTQSKIDIFKDVPSRVYLAIFNSFLSCLYESSEYKKSLTKYGMENFGRFVFVSSKIKNLATDYAQSLKSYLSIPAADFELIREALLKSDSSLWKFFETGDECIELMDRMEGDQSSSTHSEVDLLLDMISNSEITDNLVSRLDSYLENPTIDVWKLLESISQLSTFEELILDKLRWVTLVMFSQHFMELTPVISSKILANILHHHSDLIPLLPRLFYEKKLPQEDRQLTNYLSSVFDEINNTVHLPLATLIHSENPVNFIYCPDFSPDMNILLNVLSSIIDSHSFDHLLHLVLIITLNLANHLDNLHDFVDMLFYFVKLYQNEKLSKNLSIGSITNENIERFVTEPTLNLVLECVLWSLSDVIKYFELPGSSDTKRLFFMKLIFLLYNVDTHKSIVRELRAILCKFLNQMQTANNLQTFLTIKLEENMSNAFELEEDMVFLIFLNDIVKSRALPPVFIDSIMVDLLYLLTFEDGHVRGLVLNVLRSIRDIKAYPKTAHLAETILQSSSVLADDFMYIRTLIPRICKKSSRASDYMIDALRDHLEHIKITKISLFCFECLSSVRLPDMHSPVDKFFGKVLNSEICELSKPFMSLLLKYVVSLPFHETKGEQIFRIVSDISVSEIFHDLVFPKINDIFVIFTPEQKKKFFYNWLVYISKECSISEILCEKITSLPINSTDILILIKKLFKIVFCEAIAPFYVSSPELDAIFLGLEPKILLFKILDLVALENKYINKSALLGGLLELSGEASDIHKTQKINSDVIRNTLAKLLKSINGIIGSLLEDGTKIDLADSTNFKHIVSILKTDPVEKIVKKCLKILMNLSRLCPQILLDYLMPLFTFMASYSQRDDAKSLKIISQVIDAIIPHISVNFGENRAELLSVVDTFCSSFKHVPKHRHRTLFMSLISSLSAKNPLGIVMFSLVNNNPASNHTFEFIWDVMSEFQVPDVVRSLKYVLKHSSIAFEIDQQNSDQNDSTLKKNLKKLKVSSSLVIYVMDCTVFKRKMSSIERPYKKLIACYFLKSLTWIIKDLDHVSTNSKYLKDVEKLIIMISSYCHPVKFAKLIALAVKHHGLSNYINILRSWSSVASTEPHKYKRILRILTEYLLKFVSSSDFKNPKDVNTCTKCIFTIKNFVKKTESQKVRLELLEDLLQIRSLALQSWPIAICFAWTVSASIQSISQISQSLPVAFDFLIQLQSLIQQKQTGVYLEVVVKSLLSLTRASGDSLELYAENVLQIVYLLPSEEKFKDLKTCLSTLQTTQPDLFESLNLMTKNITPEILFAKIYQFSVDSNGLSRSGLFYILLLVYLGVLRTDRASRTRNHHINAKLLNNLLLYRYVCAKNSTKFKASYEKIIISIFYEYYLKQTEEDLFNSLSELYQDSSNCRELESHHKLTSVYHLLYCLTKKFGNTLIPFTKCIMEETHRHIVDFISNTDFSNIELFFQLCKSIKVTFLCDISNEISPSILKIFGKSLIDSFGIHSRENPDIDRCLNKHVVPAIAYMSIRLQGCNLFNNFILDLKKLLSKSSTIQYLALKTLQHICKNMPDQAPFIYHSISNDLNTLTRDKDENVSNEAQLFRDHLINLMDPANPS
ncbi:HEAT repeat-containing protein 1 [Thelohanellus kitauei]|uniref:HEAT repeat-containing protein 1 n=1 Tax=Thelohanellus kitauei TaxID=669202 RepID=A0A0C2N4T4_THEKT|nr:HEAT repeat-containing protein 1 [Thelohanellus kitauei]